MKSTKKLVTLLLSICLLTSLLIGCGGTKSSEATASPETNKAPENSAGTTAPAPSGGSLTVTSEASEEAVDLTAVGTTDWARWDGYDQKSSGGSKISNYTLLGTGTVERYEDDPRQISWSDGMPTASGSNNNGIFIEGNGNGFSIEVPAGTTAQTLKLYVGGWKSSGKLIAHLSDGSAADFTETTEQAEDSFDRVYTLSFKAASEGQKLNVKWLQSSSGEGNVTLQAAVLQ